jgi:hypothetical protein
VIIADELLSCDLDLGSMLGYGADEAYCDPEKMRLNVRVFEN